MKPLLLVPLAVVMLGCAHPKRVEAKPSGQIVSPLCIKVVCKGDWIEHDGGVSCSGELKAQVYCAGVVHE